MNEVLFLVLVTVFSNLIIGILIGISGIAGFLLPLIYVGILGIPLRDALALGFIAFFTGGIFGAISYWKLGNIDLKFAKTLSLGSIFGSILGVRLNILIPTDISKIILYIVVLLSGISILIRKDEGSKDGGQKLKLLENPIFVIGMGFVTGAICSLTGAGGPILVVPILIILGINAKIAVGVAIFNSIIIAIPATIGYLMNSDLTNMGLLITSSVIFHAIGVIFGARISDKINIDLLKKIVSIISISSAVYMLIKSIISM